MTKQDKRYVFTPEEGIKLRELYATGKYQRGELAQFFPGRTAKQCVTYIHNNKIKNKEYEFWSKEEDQILKELCESGKYRYEDMVQFFKEKTRIGIIGRAARLNINNTFKNILYTFDENYFDELTLENIYYGGLFCADGCISYRQNRESNECTFTWQVCEKDLDQLQKFTKKIKSTYPITNSVRPSPIYKDRMFKQYRFSTSRAHRWAEKLKEHFGIIQHKTKRFPPPNLKTNKEKLAYIRGFLDGDGTIAGINPEKGQFSIRLCSCNKELLSWIKNFIDSLNFPSFSQRGNSNITTVNKENCFYYSFCGLRAVVFYELMMRINTPFFERKWLQVGLQDCINYWKSYAEWPSEIFFENILNG